MVISSPINEYKKYHQNDINILIHRICIPLLLCTFMAMCNTFISYCIYIFYNTLYLGFLYNSKYYSLHKNLFIFVYLTIISTTSNYIKRNLSFNIIFYIHIFSWIAQFIGHFLFEKNKPALLDNFFNSIFWAPLAIFY